MFKKAKRKIVISILIILCAVLVGTLGMIYLSSYISLTTQNYDVLESHAATLLPSATLSPGSDAGNGKKPDNHMTGGFMPDQDKFKHRMEVNTFYSVLLPDNGDATVIENGANIIYSDDDLISFAKNIESETKGRIGNLIFITEDYNGEKLVCFMDNTLYSESFTRIFLFTLIFGIIALIIIAFISVHIANRIVSPMEDTYEKQKQFTADASHELKTPIAAMSANIELLQREIGENKWLDNISCENSRMQELVTELLELAKNENKTSEKKITDLSHLVNGAILPLEAAAYEKSILIESDVQENITANIDEKGISQLVTILIDNAISHTKCENGGMGKISVKLCTSKGVPHLSVTNPGEAIPEDEREKIFERFYRTDASHEFTGHYGLGLAIAKAIAVANNADLTVSCQDGLVTFNVMFRAK